MKGQPPAVAFHLRAGEARTSMFSVDHSILCSIHRCKIVIILSQSCNTLHIILHPFSYFEFMVQFLYFFSVLNSMISKHCFYNQKNSCSNTKKRSMSSRVSDHGAPEGAGDVRGR